MEKVYFESYGCPSNFADEEFMKGLLKNAGFEITNDFKEADLIVLNTCNVKGPTSNRMLYRISFFTKLSKPLIIAGCMPKTEREKIERINSKASLLGPNSIFKIVEAAKVTLKGKKFVFLEDIKKAKLGLPRVRRNRIISIVPISSGCLCRCSFCIVRFARGRLFSYKPSLIIDEIKKSINEGCREIWLTSQDNGCYGFDINTNLAKLLEMVAKLEGKFFVRVGMMNPTFVKIFVEELVESYESEKIFKFIHLPVQSGSDKVLRDMRRGYKVIDFLEIVRKFRKKFPKITLSTDIIVGYPTESEKDFKKTINLLKKIKPDIVNLSKFEARPLTEAAKLKQLDKKVVKRRSKIIHELCRELFLEKNRKWIGWEGEVIIDERGKDKSWIGRNFAYKPIVVKSQKNLFGKFVRVRVIDARSNFLIGELIGN